MADEPQVAGNDQPNAGDDQQTDNGQNEADELRNQLKELEDARREDQKYITQLQQKNQDEPTTPQPSEDDVTKSTRQWLEEHGYVTEEQLKKKLEETLTEREGQRQVADAVKTLSQKYNGKGDYKDYPTFNEEEILKYAQENQIFNLEEAYQSFNRPKILDAEIKKAQTKTATVPDRSDAPPNEPVDKETIAKKVTPDVVSDTTKLAEMLRELGQGSTPGK